MKRLLNVSMLLALLLFGFTNRLIAQNKKICVLSDIHVLDPSLLINDGVAFQTYLAMDRKMIKESAAILESALDSIVALNPDILLVTGDLTKDGEFSSHQYLANALQAVENQGIKVYVIPGNHDVNNPEAYAYDGANVISVPTISPAQFDSLYTNFGYGEAISKDPNSLSYLVEPFPGFQILAMDPCRYDNNFVLGHSETGGGYEPDTYAWILSKIQSAVASNKCIIGMQHHNLMEHYVGQKSLFNEYVIDGWDTISTQFADAGLKAMFTGHFHAHDIVKKTNPNGNYIYDIETGSTVTYPSPYRIVDITPEGLMTISGATVDSIDFFTNNLPFQQFAYNYIATGLPILVQYMLMSPPYSVDATTAAMIEPAITEAFIAHYSGNEGEPSAQSQAIISMLLASPYYTVGYAILSIWNDPMPDDWNMSDYIKTQPEPFRLTILHNNDGESKLINPGTGLENYGGISRFTQVVKNLRTQSETENTPSILLSSGDNFLPGPQFNASIYRLGGLPFYDAQAFDTLNYDAICLGNHDFDFGPAVLGEFISDITNTNINFLSANLNFNSEPSLTGHYSTGKLANHKIITRGTEKIGVIGLTTPALSYISSPGNVVVESNLDSVVMAEVNYLKNVENVNKIILISHLQSLVEDYALISQISDVDIIIAGGGDALLGSAGTPTVPQDGAFTGPYPIRMADANGDTVLVVTTPGEYKYVGRLVVEFDADGNISLVDTTSSLVRVAGPSLPGGVSPDPWIQSNITDSIQAYVNGLAANVIANTQVPLDGIRTHVRNYETNLGNMVADALLWQANELASSFGLNAVQVGFQNGGGIRNNSIIPVGNVNELHTFNILPFANFVSIVQNVSPAKLKELCENSVSVQYNGGNSGDGRFAQVAGCTLVWDTTAQSLKYDLAGNILVEGKRVWSLVLDNGTVIVENGILNPNAPNVNLATNDFSAKGGDQWPLASFPFTTLGVTYQMAFYNYITQHLNGTITQQDYPVGGEGRIVKTGAPNTLPLDWNFTVTSDSHTIFVPANANLQIAGTSVELGDYLGVFYTNNGQENCAGYVQWTGANAYISVWGDDSYTAQKDGMADGETFMWKIWSVSNGFVYESNPVYDMINYSDSALFTAQGISGISALNAWFDTQLIPLHTGWNMFSTYIDPFNNQMNQLVNPVVSSLVIVKNENGLVYWPQFNLNSIGDLSDGRGYKAKMNANATLPVSGYKLVPENTPISLPAGWSMPGYTRTTASSLTVALSSVLSEIYLIKDEMGNIFFPTFGINDIHNLIPGKAYMFNMLSAQNFSYNSNGPAAISKSQTVVSPVHFTNPIYSSENHSLIIPSTAWTVLPSVGSEIAVIGEQGNIAGVAVFNGTNVAMSIWSDDSLTPETEGLQEGENFELVCFDRLRSQTSKIVNLRFSEGSNQFKTNGISIVNEMEANNSSNELNASIYPNPMINQAQIAFNLSGETFVKAEVYNALGQRVAILTEDILQAGSHSINFNKAGLTSGHYSIRISTQTESSVLSIVVE